MPRLTGESIYLRPIALRDVNETYLQWLNNPETTKGLATKPQSETLESLEKFVQRAINDPDTAMFAICDKSNDNHIGNIKLDRFDRLAGTCELGLLIGDQDYWGKGIGKEACRLAIEYAFEQLKMRKIVLAVYANNPAALRLYENLGFVKEGCLRQQIFDGETYHDKYFMGLFREELK